MPTGDAAWPWLRFDNEATTCPACGSSAIHLLDAFSAPRDRAGHRVRFIAGCDACGLVFANPLPSSEELAALYADDGPWAARRAARRERLEAAQRRRLARNQTRKRRRTAAPARSRDLLFAEMDPYLPVSSPPSGAKALDVGCGEGKFLDWLQERGWHTYGIEPSTDLAFLRHASLISPPQDRSFALVILHHVLEHVTSPLDLLRQVAGALSDSGVLFISVPRLDTLPLHGDFAYCLNARTHPVSFTEDCLRHLLTMAGLAMAGRLDAPSLDQAYTEGKSLRLRLVATHARAPSTGSAAPLRAARVALAGFDRRRGLRARARRLLPVRLRASLIDTSHER